MSIRVRFFASLADRVGLRALELSLTAPRTARSVWAEAVPDLAPPANVLVAINQHYAGLDDLVADGDELAFMPPVTGG